MVEENGEKHLSCFSIKKEEGLFLYRRFFEKKIFFVIRIMSYHLSRFHMAVALCEMSLIASSLFLLSSFHLDLATRGFTFCVIFKVVNGRCVCRNHLIISDPIYVVYNMCTSLSAPQHIVFRFSISVIYSLNHWLIVIFLVYCKYEKSNF